MTLQDLAQLGGIIGVIASLIYVAIQIRSNVRALRGATFNLLSSSMTSTWFNMATNRELTDILLRGGDDLATLDRNERARFRFHSLFMGTFFQNAHFQEKIGTIKEADWLAIGNNLNSYYSMPGARAVWPTIKNRFNPEFQAFVDEIVARHAGQGEHHKAAEANPPPAAGADGH